MRPLREIKDNSVFVLHAENAKSAEFLFLFVFNAGAGVVANFVTTRERREFIHYLLDFSPYGRRLSVIRLYPARGEGVDKLSAHSCRNEVCDHSSASVK